MDICYIHITQLMLFKGILHFVKCKTPFIGCQLFFDFFENFLIFFRALRNFNQVAPVEEIMQES
jgi:hypothetical protein